MRRTTRALRRGMSAGRSRRSCGWHPKVDSPERCSMRAAGPARTLFTSPRWDCRFWASTWLRRHWRSPGRRPTTVGSRSSSQWPTRSSWSSLGRRFETVLDCGLFHTFDGDERPRYVASLASVTEHGGTVYVLCFSDDGPDTGPHPVSREELRAAFDPGDGWKVAAIEPDRIRDEIPRRRRTGLVRDHRADLAGGRVGPVNGRHFVSACRHSAFPVGK